MHTCVYRSLTSLQKGTTYCPSLSAYNAPGPLGQGGAAWGGVYSKALTDLIHECLYEVPSHRPTAKQLKERIWQVTDVMRGQPGHEPEPLSNFVAEPSQAPPNAVPAPAAVAAPPQGQVPVQAIVPAPPVIPAPAQAVRPANPNPLNSGRNCSCLMGLKLRANGTTEGSLRWCRQPPSRRPEHLIRDRCRFHQDLNEHPDYIPPLSGVPAIPAMRRARRRR